MNALVDGLYGDERIAVAVIWAQGVCDGFSAWNSPPVSLTHSFILCAEVMMCGEPFPRTHTNTYTWAQGIHPVWCCEMGHWRGQRGGDVHVEVIYWDFAALFIGHLDKSQPIKFFHGTYSQGNGNDKYGKELTNCGRILFMKHKTNTLRSFRKLKG